MPVAIFALDGEEEIARGERARVDRDAVDRRRARRRAARRRWRPPLPRGSTRAGSCGEPLDRGRDRVVVRERQGALTDDLPRLMAFSGDEHDIAPPMARTAAPIASARSPISTAPGAPARMARRMAAGSSERGLSSVTITRSAASAAILPISGRLPGSRSPPQPKTTVSRPLVKGRKAAIAFASASGLCE